MRRQDQRAAGDDPQPVLHRHAARVELIHLLDQRGQREHDAVADQATHLLAQNSGRNEVQDRLLAADHERVARVVSALESDDRRARDPPGVHDLALALVTPLGTDDDDVACPCWYPGAR